MKLGAIYTITHTVSDTTYVGQAQNAEQRWAKHRSELKYNKHHNPRLQNAWNKHGPSAFTFEIVHVSPIGTLALDEQRWADHLKSQGIVLYNNGEYLQHPTRGVKASAETRRKISIANTGKKQRPEVVEQRASKMRGRKHSPPSAETIAKAKATRRLNNKTDRLIVRAVLDTASGATLKSVAEAAISVGVSRTHMCAMLRGRRPNTTTFVYADGEYATVLLSADKRAKIGEPRVGWEATNRREVIDTATGVTYPSATAAFKDSGYKRYSYFCSVLRGTEKPHASMRYADSQNPGGHQ